MFANMLSIHEKYGLNFVVGSNDKSTLGINGLVEKRF